MLEKSLHLGIKEIEKCYFRSLSTVQRMDAWMGGSNAQCTNLHDVRGKWICKKVSGRLKNILTDLEHIKYTVCVCDCPFARVFLSIIK